MGVTLPQFKDIASSTAVTSLALAFNVAPVGGGLIAVAIAGAAAAGGVLPTYTLADNLANVYAQAVRGADAAFLGNVAQDLWYAKNITGGSITVTVTVQTATYLTFSIYELAGADPTAPLGVTAVNHGSSATPDPGALTATAGALVLGAFTHNGPGSPTFTAGTGFTRDTDIENVAVYEPLGTEHQANVAAGSLDANWSLSSSVAWWAVAASFKAAPGASLLWSPLGSGGRSVIGSRIITRGRRR